MNELTAMQVTQTHSEGLRHEFKIVVPVSDLEALVRETNAKIVTDNGYKLAMEPKVTMPEAQDEIEDVLKGQSDLSYTVALEVLPPITLADFKSIKLERPVAEVTDAEVGEAVDRVAEQ